MITKSSISFAAVFCNVRILHPFSFVWYLLVGELVLGNCVTTGCCGVCRAALHLWIELPAVSAVPLLRVSWKLFHCLSCFTGHSVRHVCPFLHRCLYDWICMRLASFFLPQFHHCLFVKDSWVSLYHQGRWMMALCRHNVVQIDIRVRSFDVITECDLQYLNGYW